MKHFYKLTTTLAVCALCLTAEAKAAAPAMRQESNMSQIMRKMAPNAGMTLSQRNAQIAKINTNITKKVNPLEEGNMAEELLQPSTSVGPVERFLDMDGPNGEMWYYTSKLWCKPVQHEYYVDQILTEYEYCIYDSQMQLVGTIHDKMRYRDNEVRVPGPSLGIDLLPVVTQRFFNTDDKYEIVVSIAVNTTTEGMNAYRSVIYSLNGDKETLPVYDAASGKDVEKVCDKPVAEYESFINDVLDASTNGDENYFMTFAAYDTPDFLENIGNLSEEEMYWELVKSQTMILNIRGKVDASGELSKVASIKLPYLQFQGNQETSAVAISSMYNGKPYMVVPHYKEPFFNPYYSTTDDISMREGNSLVIDMYELHPNSATLAYTTEIPMMKDTDHDAYFTYYSVGNLRWGKDIDFGHFTTDGKPSFYVMRSNFKIALDGEADYCFYVYDSSGKLKTTLFEYADSNVELTNVEGENPLHCFVFYDEDYYYYMVDLYEGLTRKTVTIPATLQADPDSDPDLMLANFDRVPMGAGDWKYCFELRVPTVDEDENDVMRVAWFDKAGKYERMDYINMGKNVYYAQSYMNGAMLHPKTFHSGDEYEYMLLVKRGIQAGSTESQEELIVAQPQSEDNDWKGKTLLHLQPCEKGAMRNIQISPVFDGTNKLMITWLNESDGENGYTADFYDLPFDKSSAGIGDITGESDSRISFDGNTVKCQGENITIYNMQGVPVAQGIGEAETASLPAGIYLAVAGESTLKIAVK
ncbi:MAG: hypothetical protein NC102_02965 [Clostridium sp.]|nr:hypothetical protein [Clostridium sp.]